MSLCDSCKYQYYVEQLKPCIIYRDDCEFYEADDFHEEPKVGHWIRWYEQKEHDSYIENIPHCKCSECGKEYDPYSSQFIKYCNECGAKMSESEDNR